MKRNMSIQNIVVLMLENRSFDHLLGSRMAADARVAGLTGNEFNLDDPRSAQSPQTKVTPATQILAPYGIPFDPAHEFPDVQIQLYGPQAAVAGQPPIPNPPTDPAPMNGFMFSANSSVKAQGDTFVGAAKQVMEYFLPEQLPVLSALAQNFAIFNWWFSPLPGPTWPNRYFIHAATSGGVLPPESSQPRLYPGSSPDGGMPQPRPPGEEPG